MGKRGPKRNAAAAPPPLQKPQGVAGKRRTPTSAFDSAAGNDIYEPEKIIATRSAKGVTQRQRRHERRTEWSTVWKPRPKPIATETEPTIEPTPCVLPADGAPGGSADAAAPAPPDKAMPLTKKRKVSLGSLLGGRVKKEVATLTVPKLDELEQYLADPEEPDLDDDVLKWWRAKESRWPALAKMVKQYLAAPASSGGVERVFSAAGKMHGDLQKSAKDSTLEHSLFAAFNTD